MIDIVIDGIIFGLILALLGAGITLTFGLREILNFAYGDFVTLTGLITILLLRTPIHHLLPSAVLAILAICLIGLGIEQTFNPTSLSIRS